MEIFTIAKMYTIYLKEDKDFGVPFTTSTLNAEQRQKSDKFIKTFMIDSLLKSLMLLYEETWKSREMLN